MNKYTLFQEDLEFISSKLCSMADRLQGSSFFITGANGFVGIWLIESLLYLSEKYGLEIKLVLLTRSELSFFYKFPHLSDFENVEIIEGDVLDFKLEVPKLDYIIHAANLPFDCKEDWAYRHMEFGIKGTMNILSLAEKYSIKSLLLTSSGAVYRNFFENCSPPFLEKSIKLTLDEAQVYSRTKQTMELLCSVFGTKSSIPVSIVRLFTFSGAYIPLEKGFALGNFIQKALKKDEIVIESSGNSLRSYMYGADMVVWLLISLLNKTTSVFNVGSSEIVSINELANYVSTLYNGKVRILGKDDLGYAPNNYFPDTTLSIENNFSVETCFEEGIKKTYHWYSRLDNL